MNPTDLPLRDIHLPDPVGWWPPAPGWWIVAIIVLLLISVAMHVYRQRRAWQRSAIFIARGELEKINAAWQQHGDTHRLASELSTWLRRVVISIRAREQAASLTGAQWWRYLDELAGHTVFGPEGGRLITEAPYRAATEIDGPRLVTLCQRWIDLLADRATADSDDRDSAPDDAVWRRRAT